MIDYNDQEALQNALTTLEKETENFFPSREENSAIEVINNYLFDLDNWDSEHEKVPNVHITKPGLTRLAAVLIDYDLIAVDESGNISMEDSNAPKVAAIVKELIPTNILLDARRAIVGESKQIKNYMNKTMNKETKKNGLVSVSEKQLHEITRLSAEKMLEDKHLQYQKEQLQEAIDKQVFTICEEVSKEFELGKPGTFRSGSGEDYDKYTHSIANTYNHAGRTRTATNSDMFNIGNGNESDSRYFNSKKDAIQWVKTYIKDEEQANMLMSALQQYIRLGGGRFITNKHDINNN